LSENNEPGNNIVWHYTLRDKLLDSAYFLGRLGSLRRLALSSFAAKRINFETYEDATNETDLAQLFTKHGSDKSTHHDYHTLYSELLGRRRFLLNRIVEIGIGSIDLATPQNMGLHGHPGGSLRAFRDWAPFAEIIGADIDEKTLFNEERISTCLINQLDPESFIPIKGLIGEGADLIVVDGLHTPRADINSLIELLPKLNPHGCFVIEDISPRAAYMLWPFALLVLKRNFTSSIRKMKNGYVFVLDSGNLRT
jgi:hypothetical protein